MEIRQKPGPDPERVLASTADAREGPVQPWTAIMADVENGIYRRVYAGFIWGRRICSVTMSAEAWFWRLHAIADDHGNLPGDGVMLAGLARGRRSDITDKDICLWCNELEDANLIVAYEAKGERYYHVLGFERLQPTPRTGKLHRKYPLPTENVEALGSAEKRLEALGSAGKRVEAHGSKRMLPFPFPYPYPLPEEENTSASSRIAFVDGRWSGITDDHRKMWASAYPACDLDRQLAAMAAWLASNPRQAKKSNWSRFVTNWLSRAQDKGGDVRASQGASNGKQHRSEKRANEYPENIAVPVGKPLVNRGRAPGDATDPPL